LLKSLYNSIKIVAMACPNRPGDVKNLAVKRS
jgi:hypothetical protein